MVREWDCLPDAVQVALAREALARAIMMIAEQADALAQEIECGNLADRGGADALRLFAAVVRINGKDDFSAAGRA